MHILAYLSANYSLSYNGIYSVGRLFVIRPIHIFYESKRITLREVILAIQVMSLILKEIVPHSLETTKAFLKVVVSFWSTWSAKVSHLIINITQELWIFLTQYLKPAILNCQFRHLSYAMFSVRWDKIAPLAKIGILYFEAIFHARWAAPM